MSDTNFRYKAYSYMCQIALAYSSLAQVGWPDPLRAKLEKRLADLL